MPILTDHSPERIESSWRQVAIDAAVFVAAIGALTAFGLSMTLAYLPARLLLPRALRTRWAQGVMTAFFRRYFDAINASGRATFDMAALDALRDEPPMVLVANHPALLDAMMFAARLPRMVCIMKADVRLNPVFGGAAALSGYWRADRPLEMLHAMNEALAAGQHVLIFPESTRTTQFPVNPFKGNFALIAKQARVPVQAVFVETDTPFLGKGWSLLRKPPCPFRFSLRLGRRFPCDVNAKRLLGHVESYFRSELGSSRTPRL